MADDENRALTEFVIAFTQVSTSYHLKILRASGNDAYISSCIDETIHHVIDVDGCKIRYSTSVLTGRVLLDAAVFKTLLSTNYVMFKRFIYPIIQWVYGCNGMITTLLEESDSNSIRIHLDDARVSISTDRLVFCVTDGVNVAKYGNDRVYKIDRDVRDLDYIMAWRSVVDLQIKYLSAYAVMVYTSVHIPDNVMYMVAVRPDDYDPRSVSHINYGYSPSTDRYILSCSTYLAIDNFEKYILPIWRQGMLLVNIVCEYCEDRVLKLTYAPVSPVTT